MTVDNSVYSQARKGIQMDASLNGAVPSIGKLEIKSPGAAGMDPMLAALMAKTPADTGLLGGGGGGGILALLLLAMFSRNGGGLFGGGGDGGGVAAAQALSTSKDVMQQLNTFQSWAANNATQIQQSICGVDKSICSSTGQIVQAVSQVTPQMFQAFTAQSQMATAQVNNLQATMTAQNTAATDAIQSHINTMEDNLNNDIHDAEKSISAGFAADQLAQCQTQNLVNQTSAATQGVVTSQAYALAQQLAACCCENRLAIANQNALIEAKTAALENQAGVNYAALANQLNMQTCEIKQAISADGQATRALIQANESDRLRGELADAKTALSNAQQTAAIVAACKCTNG